MAKDSKKAPGEIHANAAYTVDELLGRLDAQRHAWQSMRDKGLVVRYFGNRAMILGSDFIEFLKAQPERKPRTKRAQTNEEG